MQLVEILYQGLLSINFGEDLGDRSEYVGASDVGQCPRKAVLSKFNREPEDLATLFRYARGHLAEQILSGAFKSKSDVLPKWEHQKEVKHVTHPHFRAHIDFLFTAKESLGVLEVKTVDGIPRVPYDGWIQQLHFQMGLLKDCYPKKHVKGAILAIDFNAAELQLFDGFKYSSMLYEGLLLKASHIWECMNDTEVSPQTEKSPLCAWCKYRPSCPAYDQDEEIPSLPLEKELQEYLGLKENMKDLKEQIDKLANMFKAGIENATPDSDSIRVGENVVRRSGRTRTLIDGRRLQKDLPEIHAKYSTKSTYEVLVVE